jgi:hypothetical protein
MIHSIRRSTWRAVFELAFAVLLIAPAAAQVAIYDFESGTDQEFGHKFSNDGSSEQFPIVSIGGSLRMQVLRDGDFQEAERTTSNPADAEYMAMSAASGAESLYLLSYDWYIDTSPGNFGSFLQVGTYVNTGSGYYAQDFPGVGKDVELAGPQLSSGGVFSGTVTETFSNKGFDIPSGETFFRFGLIMNGDGANATVYFDNIRISPIPEPVSMALVGAAIPVLFRRRRVPRCC